MNLSSFGQKLTGQSGILELMDDLGKAMAGGPVTAMFGGGNPAHVPELITLYKARLAEVAADESAVKAVLSNYDTPRGNTEFINELTKYLNRKFGWKITPDHIAVTPGSQNGFFTLFNLLAGDMPNSGFSKILLPIVPEYIGYLDQGLQPDMFTAHRPRIELTGDHTFKYRIDFSSLGIGDDTAAICISRPTNPTGNVISREELEHLRSEAKKRRIPLIIDNAYGLPFPGIIDDQEPIEWSDELVYSMSLSKIGLPGARTGIFIARPEIANAITQANAILSLANPNIGQVLMAKLLGSGQIDQVVAQNLRPYYAQKASYARGVIAANFDDALPYRLHEHEGSFFFWLWLDGLPITTIELYNRLKARGVIVVPGEYFFTGLSEDWPHSRQCLRLNFARPKTEIDAGFSVMAEEIQKAFQEKPE